jgi:hypothetical protein
MIAPHFSRESEQFPRFGQISPSRSHVIQEFRAARALHYRTGVTLRIETTPGEGWTTIRLIGRIQTGHLSALRTLLDAVRSSIVLDLAEVSLVNLEVVRFLSTCESQGTQLLNCPAYIRKWIERERQD